LPSFKASKPITHTMKSALLISAVATLVSAASSNKTYLNPDAPIEDRIADLLPRMTLREKASQLVQGDMRNYLNLTTGAVNETGLEWTMEYRGNSVWTGLAADVEIVSKANRVAQDYLVNKTRLGMTTPSPPISASKGLY
jgi:beta-glucosidase